MTDDTKFKKGDSVIYFEGDDAFFRGRVMGFNSHGLPLVRFDHPYITTYERPVRPENLRHAKPQSQRLATVKVEGQPAYEPGLNNEILSDDDIKSLAQKRTDKFGSGGIILSGGNGAPGGVAARYYAKEDIKEGQAVTVDMVAHDIIRLDAWAIIDDDKPGQIECVEQPKIPELPFLGGENTPDFSILRQGVAKVMNYDETKKKRYQCPTCKKVKDDFEKLKIHHQKDHGGNIGDTARFYEYNPETETSEAVKMQAPVTPSISLERLLYDTVVDGLKGSNIIATGMVTHRSGVASLQIRFRNLVLESPDYHFGFSINEKTDTRATVIHWAQQCVKAVKQNFCI